MQAFTAAADYLRGKYLKECTLYVTIEPCVMCSGAAYWTQLKRVVFGAKDEKRGVSNLEIKLLHPKTTLTSGVLKNECSELMSVFFGTKRS
jgi:tRNA(adenine34) deaminase